VSRFDHARVHGTDRHLVHLVSLDLEVVHHAGGRRAREAHRLEPGMPLGTHTPFLGDLAFEEVRLGA
jgi:hypothetical protein